jgi:hypothetical protein
MKWSRNLLLLSILLYSLGAQALNGWKMTAESDALRYLPTDLPAGKTFEYRVYGPYDLEGADLKEWFSGQAQRIQQSLGEPLEDWVVKPDKQKWSISNSFRNGDGQVFSVGYEGGRLDDDRVYIMRMVSSQDLMLMMKYGFKFYPVLDEAKQRFKDKPSAHTLTVAPAPATAQAPSAAERTQKSGKESVRVAPGKGVDLSDLEAVWVYSNIDVIMGGMDVDTTLLFDDGSAYTDCAIPPDELDVEVSKRIQPNQWTKWRSHWGKYQLWNASKQTWYDLTGEPAVAIKPGTRLSGKYLSAGGSQFSGSWKRHIIFHQDGTFELSSFSMMSNSGMGGGSMGADGKTVPLITSVGSSDKRGSSGATSVGGDDVGGGGSSHRRDGSKNTGRYEVNDYSITLTHDNGYRHTELFYFEKRKGENDIVYGNDLYWLDD